MPMSISFFLFFFFFKYGLVTLSRSQNVGRSGHNGRQLVTIHIRNSMPSEMPSKHGVQRAELYTMEKQAETVSFSRFSSSHRVYDARLLFLHAISGVTSDDIPPQIHSTCDHELINYACYSMREASIHNTIELDLYEFIYDNMSVHYLYYF